MNMTQRQRLDQEIIDYSFYMIQRGESGHKNGCKEKRYRCSEGVLTIGYGTTVTRPHSLINYQSTTIDEKTALFLARAEMRYKMYSVCRRFFKDEKTKSRFKSFDKMLPCHQALMIDMAYQGVLKKKFVDAFQKGPKNAAQVKKLLGAGTNIERKLVRERALEMGYMIDRFYQKNPNMDAQQAAQQLADDFIKKFKKVRNSDCAVTKDEIALLYRSCMACYGKTVTTKEVEAFALRFDEVATGRQGIGDKNRITDRKTLVRPDLALKYLTPTRHNNNPRDAFTSKGRRKAFPTLEAGYKALVQRLQTIAKYGPQTPQQIWERFTGVKGVDGTPFKEFLKEKGITSNLIDLNRPFELECVALSISEINNGGYALGGIEVAKKHIAKAAGYVIPTIEKDGISIATQRQKNIRLVKTKKEKRPATFLDEEVQVEKAKEQHKTAQIEKPLPPYKEGAPSQKNEYNNPARICKRGKTIKYASLEEGYGALTSMLYENYNALTCAQIMRKFTGISNAQAGEKLRRYLKEYGIEASKNTKLDLNDPKTLLALSIGMTKMRQQGKVLGGEEYAIACVEKKISALQPARDGVAIVVKENLDTANANAYLATHSQARQENTPFTPMRQMREV